MTFIVFDAGSNTGYAMFNNKKLIDSGCIYTRNAKENKLTYLETKVKGLLKKHQPQKAFIEQLYSYPIIRDNKILSRSNQKYAQYFGAVNKAISDWGIPCEHLNTRKLAKKNMAKSLAKPYLKKARASSHECECIAWGLYLIERGL